MAIENQQSGCSVNKSRSKEEQDAAARRYDLVGDRVASHFS